MFYLLSFLFGASIGSFVQVIVTRLHVAPITKSRSKCLSCGETLRVSDLVPVLSYIFLKGKCRYCKVKFGVSALVIEVIFGVTFALLYHFILQGSPSLLVSFGWLAYYTLLFGVLGVMALYDKAHSYIPINALLLYGLLTLLMLFLRYLDMPSAMILLGPVLVALPFLILWLITKGKGVGFGDVLLFLGVGAFFGFSQGIVVFLISVWAGALVGLYVKYILLRNQNANNIPLPFVPYIVLAFLVVLFTDIDIFSIASLFA